MKVTRAQIIVMTVFGLAVFFVLTWFGNNIGSAGKEYLREWLVVGILLGGSYVIFSSKKDDLEYYQTRSSAKGVSVRNRSLGIAAWVLMIVGVTIAVRLILRMA